MIRTWSLALCCLAALGASAWAWQTDSTSADARPAELDGSQLFRAKGCASCHTGDLSFPRLDTAPIWAGDRRPGLDAQEYIAQSIRAPSAFISPVWEGGGPTRAMPDLELTEAEIDAITDYLLQG